MNILGINAYHGDAAACLVVDGQLVAAVEEERLCRVKHWAGYPKQSIEYCLQSAGLNARDVEHIAINRAPSLHALKKAMFILRKGASWQLIRQRLLNASRVHDIKQEFCQQFDLDQRGPSPILHHVEHHLAHMGSAYLVSPYDHSAVVSIDGFGDFVGAAWGVGEGKNLSIAERIFFPHSLGQFYVALTQFLGFPNYGDEYKVMGLAAYGRPIYLPEMRKLVRLLPDGKFELGLEYFRHHTDSTPMTWDDGVPFIDSVFSPRMTDLLGPVRAPDEPITERHHNLAASMQAMYEEAFFHLLREVHRRTGSDRLCLSGGCAMNSVANGKIRLETPFREIYIPPATGDASGAIGAAYQVLHGKLNQPRQFIMDAPYWGPQFGDDEITIELDRVPELRACASVERLNEEQLCRKTAVAIADGNVIGWFQGRMEWGPRALGNRSILVDPRNPEMKDILNARIKRRESFRPFAPAILVDFTSEYFEQDTPDPFMSRVYKIRTEKRDAIPTAVHADGTGRLQTVARDMNQRYWRVIDEFRQLTGVPIIINTSFNENEPIVHTPAQAIDCFLRTKMDILVVGSFFCSKRPTQ